ncbi:hypothetical protein CF15_03505 [Pyrodictium occultum]|uniref:Cobalamin adenosyltransferase-like domain-containing protein n=1 Tax=Pyrodictium occultum TaxID=2309 RepID=A0A0V8RV00_PYROC|nr:ATP:cob(I)alamin adenosyltransferase [Pyrodictium occultum]KSW11878.1 hypothetical protein CF15_03505 [Pyrodictium occultum]
MKLYTRTGDRGYTFCSLLGRRVRKSHPCVEFVGALDEAEATLGLAESLLRYTGARGVEGLADTLRWMQELLFRAGFTLAGRDCLEGRDVEEVEALIDKLSSGLEPVFTLNGGHPAAAAASLARTMIRRAERALWRCLEERGETEEARLVARLLNRLGDLAYAVQHAINRALGGEARRVECRAGR